MAIYTVHAPPPKAAEIAPDPERFVFVRDGFYFWAFVFGPLWVLWRRLWLVFLMYVVAVALIEVVLWLIVAPPPSQGLVWFVCSLLVGFEAATLRRWTFERRGWRQLGLISGSTREEAERRFFESWVSQAPSRTSRPPPPAVGMGPPPADIVGLFPEPQSRP